MGKPRMQTSGTGRKTDASYHLEKKTTSLVNRQGGFEGVSILKTPHFLFCSLNFNLFSHCLRKSMKKGAAILRNSLIS